MNEGRSAGRGTEALMGMNGEVKGQTMFFEVRMNVYTADCRNDGDMVSG